jgi:hypothetical protein
LLWFSYATPKKKKGKKEREEFFKHAEHFHDIGLFYGSMETSF